jgi:hypothetical protein
MAKVKKKSDDIDAEFFDASLDKLLWPKNVQVNVNSPTGYSYKTLEPKSTKMGNGYHAVNGFVIADKTWLLKDGNNNAWIETDEEFREKYSI